MPAPRILVTRSPHQASELADHLRALGADPILIPAIELTDPTSYDPLDRALQHLETFHWLLFTSANAVHAFHQRNSQLVTRNSQLKAENPSPRIPKIAAIGQATARALTAIGLTADLIPPQAIAESLAAELLPHALQPDGHPTRFLLIRAEDARDHLPETLRAAGAEVTIAPAYRTITPASSIDAIRELFAKSAPDAITFTSSSTARNFFTLLEAAGLPFISEAPSSSPGAPPSSLTPQTSLLDNPPESSPRNRHFDQSEAQRRNPCISPAAVQRPDPPLLASIGPITSATLRDLGHPPHIEAQEASVSSLAQDLVKYLDQWKTS